jgi:(p)ppGpp synthase/HD superfamily hydrolase
MHEQLKRAREFALKAHTTQTYGTIYPYYKHLEDVFYILTKFAFNESDDLDILTAAFLHDTLEDANISYSDIERAFDKNIAEIVYCMTDELGRSRKERKEKTYPKIRLNSKSLILKIADRIANVEFSSTQDSKHFKMYREEYHEFEFNLRIYRHVDGMWDHLHAVTFPGKVPTEERK